MSGSIAPPLLETVARRAGVIRVSLEHRDNKRDLEASPDVSRATINRAVNGFRECGCTVQRNGKWEVTLFGRSAYEEYERLRKRCEAPTGVQSLLRYLPIVPRLTSVLSLMQRSCSLDLPHPTPQ